MGRKGINVLSLFDGASFGKVTLDLEKFNTNKYITYEIDDDPIEVSKANHKDIERRGDVFDIDFEKDFLDTRIDLLIGGSPCTHWSVAKAGNKNEDGSDARETTSSGLGWDLFYQYYLALVKLKPTYFMYENNPSMSDEIRDEITKHLGVEPLLIDSADFSAQIRGRYYWTNIPVNMDYEKCDLVFSDIEYTEEEHRISSYEKYKDTEKYGSNVHKWDSSGKGYYSQQNRARDRHVKMNTVIASGTDKNNIYLGDFKYRKIHPIEAERCQTLPDNYTSVLKSKGRRMKVIGNGWTINVIRHIFKGLPKEWRK